VKRADSLLVPLIRDLGIKDDIRLSEIKKNWYNLFNKPLSYHMSPFKFSNGELVLNVDSPVWLQELNLRKEDIIKKMTSYGVKDIRLRLGRVSMKTTSEIKRKSTTIGKAIAKPLTSEELSYIEDTVLQISDKELRETLKRTIEKALASGRTK
jgi:hypothetical protein